MANYTWDCDEVVIVQDRAVLSNPALGVADTVRATASTLLRFLRRPLRYVTLELPPHFGYLEPGDWVWTNHDLMPEAPPPQGYETWRQIPLYVLEVHDPLSEARVTIRCVDLRETFAKWWSPLQTEIGMTADLNGIAMLNSGGTSAQTLECIRDQVGYGIRPPGNDSWQEVLANLPIIDAFGLRLEGGDDVNRLLNSTFSEGSGTTFANWSYTSSGAAFIAEWTLYTLIDANGFRRAPLLTTANAGEASYLSQTVNNLENKSFAVKVYYKDGGALDRMGLRISRSDTGEYLDSNGTWQGSTQTITLTPGSGTIDTVRLVSPAFDTTSGGAVNITISVGHFSSVATTYQISQVQGVELIELPRRYYAFRSPLPTKDVAVTRVRNLTRIDNSSGVRVLSPIRGFVKLTAVPEWSHSDLEDDDQKVVLSADFDGATDGSWFRILYQRQDVDTGVWFFQKWGAPAASLQVTGADLVTAGEDYVLIARWTSEEEDEHDIAGELAGQALDIWVDGVRGDPMPGQETQSIDPESYVYLGGSPNLDEERSWDGHVKNLTIGDNCPSEAELLRL